MDDSKRRYDAEMAGALTPELEGAAHTRAHPLRMPRPQGKIDRRGDSPSAKTDSPSGPKRP